MDPYLKLQQADYKKLRHEELDQISNSLYRFLVGCLLYLSIGTCPNITYSVQQLTEFLNCYTYAHLNTVLHMVHYLSETQVFKLHLGSDNPISLLGFTYSNWVNCLDTRWSIGRHTYTLASGIISWQAHKQRMVAASSCEAKYGAIFRASKEVIWLWTLLNAIGHRLNEPTTILCDNNTAINLSEDPLLHDHVKHIDIKHHFLHEHVQSKEIHLSYINTHDNITDIFTKALDTKKFSWFWNFLGSNNPRLHARRSVHGEEECCDYHNTMNTCLFMHFLYCFLSFFFFSPFVYDAPFILDSIYTHCRYYTPQFIIPWPRWVTIFIFTTILLTLPRSPLIMISRYTSF